jgi:leucyl/phenylalanyl-tRNA--protein transferase
VLVLDAEQVLAGYQIGLFPMAVPPDERIAWFSPDPRALIPLDERFHISHGLQRTLRKQRFEVTVDQEFERVLRACAVVHGSTWISEDIFRVYLRLHKEGYAHSVETRVNGELAGGLYGVHLGGAFFGESMFHYQTDASKVALVALVTRLRSKGFLLLDTQWTTPHLMQFATFEISRERYLRLLQKAVGLDCKF